MDAFWRPDLCPFVLRATVACEPSARPDDRLGLADLPGRKSILIAPDGRQHVLVRDAGRAIQLVCDGASVLDANAVLTVHTRGFLLADRAILAYRRLRSLRRSRRFAPSLFKPAPRARHLRNALIALDTDFVRLSRRKTAIRLYGERIVAEQWDDADGRLRGRVLNAVRRGRSLMAGGYRDLLR